MSDVPDELLREILSRLPVAPLLRFRCVSKSWKGFIDSDEFTRHHLNHSRKSNSNLNIVLKSRLRLYSADFDSLNETNMATFKQLSHPLNTPSGFTQILGSCDGLLVLRNQEDDITILWNPSIKRFRVIPCTIGIEIPGYWKNTYYGFGYDVMTDDYKLISIGQFVGKVNNDFKSGVQIYSLKSDSWRRIPDFPYSIDCTKTRKGVFANGALHWIVTWKVKSGYFIAAFDLGTEEYRLVPFPKFAEDDETLRFEVAVLGGCLSLTCYVGDNYHVDLWVMKEYGVQESWSILISHNSCGFGFTMRPLAYSKCCRKVVLVLDGYDLRWYDLDKKSFNAPMHEMPSEYIFEIFTCLQSLVLLNNGAHDLDLVLKTKQERKFKKSCRNR